MSVRGTLSVFEQTDVAPRAPRATAVLRRLANDELPPALAAHQQARKEILGIAPRAVGTAMVRRAQGHDPLAHRDAPGVRPLPQVFLDDAEVWHRRLDPLALVSHDDARGGSSPGSFSRRERFQT